MQEPREGWDWRDHELDVEERLAMQFEPPKTRMASGNGGVPEAAELFIPPAVRALTIGGAQRVPTRFATLDAITRGGPRVGKRVVIGGAPGAGKTTWLAQLLWNYACDGHLTLMAAFDEEAEDILIRIGQINGLRRDDLERGDNETRRELAAALEAHPTFLLVDGDEDGLTIEQASAELARRRRPGQLSILGIDSIQTARVVGDLDADSAKARVDLVMAALKRAGKVDKHLVLATCELNRGGYKSQNASERVDDLAAFKESGGVEYGASMALVLRSVKDVEGTVDVSVPKNRMGKKDAFRLRLDFEAATFTEVDLPSAAEREAVASPVQRLKERIVAMVGKSVAPFPASKEEARRRLQANKSRVKDAIDELLEERRLVVVDGHYQLPGPSWTELDPGPGGPVPGPLDRTLYRVQVQGPGTGSDEVAR